MNKHFKDHARPVALLPSLDQQGTHAQLWSDDRRFAVVDVPAGTLVAQAPLAVDLTYRHNLKDMEGLEKCPVVSIATLKPTPLSPDQVKGYFDVQALEYTAMRYVECLRGEHGDTVGMTPESVSAADGKLSVLFALKRGLGRESWGQIEATLSETEKESLDKYGKRHWLLTWGLYSAMAVIVVAGTWAWIALRK